VATNLVPSAANFSTVTVSVPQDGVDFRTAASLYPAFQRLTDNDAYISANFLYKNVGTFALAQALTFTGFGVVFDNGAQVNNALGVAGGIVVAGGVTSDNIANSGNISGATASFSGVVSFTGAGRIRPTFFAAPDVPATSVSVASGNHITVPLLTAATTITITNAGAVANDLLEFTIEDTGFDVVVKRNDGTTILTMRADVGSYYYAVFRFDGTHWYPLRRQVAA
jgi:hypothetical protein